MMLTEITAVPQAALPVEALKEHLRLASGFALAPDQDGLLESYLRAAMAAIEGRIAKALIQRGFSWSVEQWRDREGQALPIAPVSAIQSLTLYAENGDPTEIPPVQFRLIADLHRPKIVGVGTALPEVPTNGRAVVEFEAGFGLSWEEVPPDLRHAVLLLAAEFYEHRHDGAGQEAGLPFGVVALIERWRQIRVLGGRGRR
jgi:uncharacterized phiE125 gp8 family phage protein